LLVWRNVTVLLVDDVKSHAKSSKIVLIIFIFSFIIAVFSLFTLWKLITRFIDDREKPIDLFLTIKKKKFEELKIRSFVADRRSADEELFKSFIQKEKAQLIVSEGNEIAPFCKFFTELEPNIVQSANYIQPSYYERRGAQGVIR
jgi:hypothetical protein